MKKYSIKIYFVLIVLFALLVFCCGCTGDYGENGKENLNESAPKTIEEQSYYDRVVEAEPDNATAWCLRGMYYNNNLNRYKEALKSADKAIELSPEYGLAWLLKGYILLNTGNISRAESSFENATSYNPELKEYVPDAKDYSPESSDSFCLFYSVLD
ncbi:tetratricopeptide repeat protein [Methanomicrobium antiquum]|uniref:Tetratricopeptide repeat protein n=1 Tax=Methanomicrobium antiquum TaxID=487686 RepID=A0AAF0FQT9_9EURY|nr:tetratricopeptide repeat protein [Methanomicrobium antiquum]WFN37882.1 tetratricopeptide repeat protein [Methanomicrobium antiquum]